MFFNKKKMLRLALIVIAASAILMSSRPLLWNMRVTDPDQVLFIAQTVRPGISSKFIQEHAAVAAKEGWPILMRLMLRWGADPDAKHSWDHTLLTNAVHSGHPELVALLLEQGADIEARGGAFDDTPLHIAVQNGDREMVALLLKNAPEVDSQTGLGHTPLCQAVYSGHHQIAELLIKQGADINYDWQGGRSALKTAVGQNDIRMINILLKYDALLHAAGHEQAIILIWAMFAHRYEACKLLLDHGLDINAREGALGFSALHVAVMLGDVEWVSFLLEQGSDVQLKSENGKSALELAEAYGETQVVRTLKEWHPEKP